MDIAHEGTEEGAGADQVRQEETEVRREEGSKERVLVRREQSDRKTWIDEEHRREQGQDGPHEATPASTHRGSESGQGEGHEGRPQQARELAGRPSDKGENRGYQRARGEPRDCEAEYASESLEWG
jgi:hypothetical protein